MKASGQGDIMQTIEEALEPLRRECDRWQQKEQEVRNERSQG